MTLSSQRPLLTSQPPPPTAAPGRLLQRQCDCGTHAPGGGECEACKKKKLQRKPHGSSTAVDAVPNSVHAVLSSPGRPLDAGIRSFMEPRFGQDFSRVRVHADAAAAESARSVSALAYTVGQHIVFAPGQYDPRSSRNRRLLAHELAHTVQQAGSAGVGQAKLEIDSEGSPAEAAADQAAEAVMVGAPTPALAPIGPLISRTPDGQPIRESTGPQPVGACRETSPGTHASAAVAPWQAPAEPLQIQSITTVSETPNEAVRLITLASGARYRVTRTRTELPERSVGDDSVHTDADMDSNDVWVEFSWCVGSRNEGRVRGSANVPSQVVQLLQTTLQNGGDIGQAWRQASVTPTISASFSTGGGVTISPSVSATVDSSGHVTGAGAGVGVEGDTSAGHVRVDLQVHDDQLQSRNPLGGLGGSATVTFTPGQGTRQPCTRRIQRDEIHYRCEMDAQVPDSTRPGTQDTRTDERHVHDIYFLYAVPTFDNARNTEGLAALQADLAAGWQVSSILAYASPEGPMGRRQGSTFVGNDELSRQRATAAQTRVQGLCGTAMNCFRPDAVVDGRGERLDPQDPVTGQPQDIAGTPLEQNVDASFRTSAEEAPQRSEALMGSLGAAPATTARGAHANAERIYPWLRRASITLVHSTPGTTSCTYVVTPGHAGTATGPCTPGLISAAYPSDVGRRAP